MSAEISTLNTAANNNKWLSQWPVHQSVISKVCRGTPFHWWHYIQWFFLSLKAHVGLQITLYLTTWCFLFHHQYNDNHSTASSPGISNEKSLKRAKEQKGILQFSEQDVPSFVKEKCLLHTTLFHKNITFSYTSLAPFQIFALAQWNFFSYKRIILYDYKGK